MHLLFDYDRCTKCGQCILACGSVYLERDDENRPFLARPELCSDCGNCMAVCPVDAVVNTRVDGSDFHKMEAPGISFAQYLRLVRNRRSTRRFKPEPLKQQHIDQRLESVRYIPTGSNQQSLRYVVITDPALLDKIKNRMAQKFRLVKRLATAWPLRWFVSKEDRQGLTRMMELWDSGDDFFLRGTPCLLVIYSEQTYFGITAWDSGIATYNLDLAAQTLGLGTLHNGFFVTTARMFKSIKRLTGVPKKATILGAMCLGYPVVKFRKTVWRRPLQVTYLGSKQAE
jgi:nitroreductase/NAD-dependent dihydropyrimidine dehydrogenase PreA subunit